MSTTDLSNIVVIHEGYNREKQFSYKGIFRQFRILLGLLFQHKTAKNNNELGTTRLGIVKGQITHIVTVTFVKG